MCVVSRCIRSHSVLRHAGIAHTSIHQAISIGIAIHCRAARRPSQKQNPGQTRKRDGRATERATHNASQTRAPHTRRQRSCDPERSTPPLVLSVNVKPSQMARACAIPTRAGSRIAQPLAHPSSPRVCAPSMPAARGQRQEACRGARGRSRRGWMRRPSTARSTRPRRRSIAMGMAAASPSPQGGRR